MKYLAASLILNSGARTGVLANLKMSEVFDAEKCVYQTSSDDVAKHYYVVSVSHHKTSYQGPVQIPLANREYRALMNMCMFVKSHHPDSDSPFVTYSGTTYSVSRLSREWNRAWEDWAPSEVWAI